MRYKLDVNGYVIAVSFGCYLDGCAEYTGANPIGYNSLEDWATYSCVNAYYIDDNGNLTLDQEKLAEIRRKEAQEKVDNAPLLRKDIYQSEAILDSQYVKNTVTSGLVVLDDVKPIAPKVKITGIDASAYTKLSIITQGKNLMPCDAVTQTISGVDFTVNNDGLIEFVGEATDDIEYIISNSTPFVLKKGCQYHFELGNNFEYEFRYFDGETTLQQYVGSDMTTTIRPSQSIIVNQVVIKIPKGGFTDCGLEPILYLMTGDFNYNFLYVAHKQKMLEIDFSEFVDENSTVDYILIENGVVSAKIDGIEQVIGSGNVGLFSGYNTIYATEDTTLEITYSTNIYNVEDLKFLQGKGTNTGKFVVLADGSIVAHDGLFSGKVTGSSFEATGSITKYAKDYGQTDLTNVRAILDGTLECTPEYLEKYDLDGNGVINALDYLIVSKLVNGTDTSRTLNTSVKIDPRNGTNILETEGVAIRPNGIYGKSVVGKTIYADAVQVKDTANGSYLLGITGQHTIGNNVLHIINGIIVGIS